MTARTRHLPHLATRVFSAPLAIAPSKLEAILGALGDRLGVQAAGFELEGFDPREEQRHASSVAVIPVVGTLVARGLGGVEALSGLSGYRGIGEALDEALDDDQVEAILLDVDSYGGEVQGMLDLADKIRGARAIKPVWASVNENAYSAAYALASAAERVYVSRAGGVGSIGVVAAHRDQSQADRAEGVAYTFVHAGDSKVDGNPHAPLGDRARASLQGEVDRLYGLFLESVAADGRMSAEQARATQAATYHGAGAVEAGLADELGTIDDALAALQEQIRTRGAHPSPFGRANPRPFPVRS